ncbi:PASTA domain-containing protein [Streptomyces sp. NPDC001502]|uniref:PASTA domain-containing protein n=1 Tax=Streptomyces sp. NPDC001502 TaxID=3364578 RepID=UPI0036B41AEC
MSGPLPAPELSKPPRQPQNSAPTGWWRTNPARIGFIAAVPICGLIAPGLGLVALAAALVALWLDNPWPKQGKVVATIAAGALLGAVAPAPAKNGPQGHPAALQGTPVAAAPTVSAAPVVSRRPLQDFRGQSLEVAYSRITKTGARVVFHDASDGDETIKFSSRGLWTVCFQKEAGTGIDAYPTVELGAVHRGDPCPTQDGGPLPLPTMPDLVGKTWAQAHPEVVALGVPAERVRARTAYVNDTLPDEGKYDAWRVCAHDPADGEPIRNNTDVTLYLSSPANGCPESHRGTGASAILPDRDDDGDPDYRDPYPSDRNRNHTFPDGLPKDSGDSNDSDGHGWNPCRHTRWC